MKIFIVTAESPLRGGGGLATYILNAARAHIEQGNRVLIVSWRIGEEGEAPAPSDWVRVYPLNAAHFHEFVVPSEELGNSTVSGWEMRVAVHLSRRLEALISEEQPDVVEGSDYLFPFLPLLQRVRAGYLLHRPVFLTFHHGLQEDIWAAAALMAGTSVQKIFASERNVMCLADGVLAPSEAAYRNLIDHKGVDAERTFLVREPLYWPDRQQNAFTERRENYLYFGRVAFAKGVDRVCRFFNFVSAKDARKRLRIVGPQIDFPLKKRRPEDYIRRHIESGALTAEYRSYALEEVSDILSSSGTFLNFSRTETFSYTSVEAISHGLRLIVDQRSAAAELYPAELRVKLPRDWDTCPEEARRADDAIGMDEISAVQEYASALTQPSAFAATYYETVEKLRERLDQRKLQRRQKKNGTTGVSALIATHNDGPLLLEAVDAILSQTTPISEVLVYNDGSTDEESLEIYSRLGEMRPIKVINGEAVGLIGARNRLLATASSPFCFFLDADDILRPTFIEKSIRVFKMSDEPIDAVIPWRQNFGLNRELICDFLLSTPMHLIANDFRMTALMRTQVAQQIGFRPDLIHGEADDWDFWLRFSLLGFKAEALPEPLFLYRVSDGSMSYRWSEGQARLSAEVLANSVRELASQGKVTPQLSEYMFRMLYSYRYFSEH
ncbi:glycosyltransferase [Bradyrhizobium elkanii]|uniref:glycosyltransferase n=1 Tax=Bradyrhizobium elkanii TaxID=29448 RepID=UPI003D1A906C